MKNKAKCAKCGSIIESFHANDYVACKCEAIWVYGGDSMHCGVTTAWQDFLRIDDMGNEIAVKCQNKNDEKGTDHSIDQPPEELSRKEMIEMLDTLIKNFEHLPEHAKLGPVNHYDLISFMLVISNILKKG